MALLKKASEEAVRLKMYVYGESGTGKTVTALHFPKPAVIDAEKGTEHYGSVFDFDVMKTNNTLEINELLDSLIEDPQGYKTLVVDPFSAIYDRILDDYEKRMKKKTGNPAYVLQPVDYRVIKSEVKNMVLKLLALDMNVIVTARQAVEYAKEGFMQAIGTKPEGPGSLPYMFDVVLKLEKKGNVRMAYVEKDRTNKLPESFEFSYQELTKYLDIKELEREPVVLKQKAVLNKAKERTKIVQVDGNEIKTAGVEAENLLKLKALANELGSETVQQRLREDFMVDSLLDLKDDEAELLIKFLMENTNNN